MPRIRSLDPSINCYLVGSDMPNEFHQMAGEGIVPIGQVANLAEIFDSVRLTIAPLAYGAGLKGKVIDSLAAGVPCVCTTVAAEGLPLPQALRHHVIDETADICTSVMRLHTGQAENAICRDAGLDFVSANFSEARVDELMRGAMDLRNKVVRSTNIET